MTLLLASSEAKPKCHLGCQALLHMSMVHPRSECSWVIEHCTAPAVERRTCYLKKTPILVITDLILVTHQYALPFYVKLPRRSSCKMKHTQKNTLKGFCWAIWWFGKSAASLVIWQFCSYENKGSINLVLLQHCEVWRQIGTKLDLKSALLLMLFWTGGGFWGVHECWKVLDQPLHFGGKREKKEISNANLTGEICLGSVVLARGEETGLCTQLCQGHCRILGSCMTFASCMLVFLLPIVQTCFGTIWVYNSTLHKTLQLSFIYMLQ